MEYFFIVRSLSTQFSSISSLLLCSLKEDWILHDVRILWDCYARTGNPWNEWNESGISWTWLLSALIGCLARPRLWAPYIRNVESPGPFYWPTSMSEWFRPGARSWPPMLPRPSEGQICHFNSFSSCFDFVLLGFRVTSHSYSMRIFNLIANKTV